MPTAEDGNYKGKVLSWHREIGIMVTGWFIIGVSDMYTNWIRTPGKPADKKGKKESQY